MTINATEIKAAVELLQPTDFTDGVPNLLAVQRVCGDDKITAEDVANAMKPAEGDGGTKVQKDGTGIAPPKSVETIVSPLIQTDAAHTVKPEADREDGTGSEPLDPVLVKQATAAAAEAERLKVQAGIDALAVERAALDAKIKEGEVERSKLETVIEANTVEVNAAEMVKRIQKQTQDRLQAQAEARNKIAETLKVAGLKTYASPLDQALAGGAKRSKVLQPGGKVFEAPHPRSPEGVKSYGNWIHHGARQQA